jgi:hypothetical protein
VRRPGRFARAIAVGLAFAAMAQPLRAWGERGHRFVANVASRHLTGVARANVAWLLGPESLDDVASWADAYQGAVTQTATWHYVDMPPDATSYDRDRDCPLQPGVTAGSRKDTWRDCVVDRILYNEQRLADVTLDRADRAIALKFVVHFVGDLHQPLHAMTIARGGNDIPVNLFGSDLCGAAAARPAPCNLHSVWDTLLITHRNLDDAAFETLIDQRVTRDRLLQRPLGTPAAWAMESLTLANAALLPAHGRVDEAYFRKQMPVIEARLALAAARLAQVLNRALVAKPPA